MSCVMVSSRDQEVSEDICVVFLPSSFGVIRTLKQSWVREYHTFSCVSCPRAIYLFNLIS